MLPATLYTLPGSAKGSSTIDPDRPMRSRSLTKTIKRDTKCTMASEDSAVERRSCSVPPGYDVSDLEHLQAGYPQKPGFVESTHCTQGSFTSPHLDQRHE